MRRYRVATTWRPVNQAHRQFHIFEMEIPNDGEPWGYAAKVFAEISADWQPVASDTKWIEEIT